VAIEAAGTNIRTLTHTPAHKHTYTRLQTLIHTRTHAHTHYTHACTYGHSQFTKGVFRKRYCCSWSPPGLSSKFPRQLWKWWFWWSCYTLSSP